METFPGWEEGWNCIESPRLQPPDSACSPPMLRKKWRPRSPECEPKLARSDSLCLLQLFIKIRCPGVPKMFYKKLWVLVWNHWLLGHLVLRHPFGCVDPNALSPTIQQWSWSHWTWFTVSSLFSAEVSLIWVDMPVEIDRNCFDLSCRKLFTLRSGKTDLCILIGYHRTGPGNLALTIFPLSSFVVQHIWWYRTPLHFSCDSFQRGVQQG